MCGFFGGATQTWTGGKGVADLCLTTWLWRRNVQKTLFMVSVFCIIWSGRRDSNSRRSPWQGDALPLSHSRIWCLRVESNRRHRDFQSLALPTELQRHLISFFIAKKAWRPGWGSNPRPLAWQASVLTSWTTGPYKGNSGGSYRARTCDILLVRQTLSQLS